MRIFWCDYAAPDSGWSCQKSDCSASLLADSHASGAFDKRNVKLAANGPRELTLDEMVALDERGKTVPVPEILAPEDYLVPIPRRKKPRGSV